MESDSCSDDSSSSAHVIDDEDTCHFEEDPFIFQAFTSDPVHYTSSMDDTYLKTLRGFNHVVCGDEDTQIFLLMDIDIVTDKHHGTVAVLFGRISPPSNQSINVIVSGWYAYFFIEEPVGWIMELGHQAQLQNRLKQALTQRLEQEYPGLLKTFHLLECEPIVCVERTTGTNIMGYHPSAKNKTFLKIKVATPAFIRPLRECFEGGYCFENDGAKKERAKGMAICFDEDFNLDIDFSKSTRTYNSNLEPVLQFMVDKRLSGCQWCQVPLAHHFLVQMPAKTTCDLELLHCNVDQLCLLELSERSDAGSIRVLSFDLEAAGRKGVFPDPAIDPVIQIGIHFQICASEQVLFCCTLNNYFWPLLYTLCRSQVQFY